MPHPKIDPVLDAKAYDLRAKTGLSWSSVAARLGLTTYVARTGAERHAERHGLPSLKSSNHSERAKQGHEGLRKKRVRFERKCLNCGEKFRTASPYVRICPRTECQELIEGGTEDYGTP